MLTTKLEEFLGALLPIGLTIGPLGRNLRNVSANIFPS